MRQHYCRNEILMGSECMRVWFSRVHTTQTKYTSIERWTLDVMCRTHSITCSPLNNYNHNITKHVQYRCRRALKKRYYCFKRHTHKCIHQYVRAHTCMHACIRKYIQFEMGNSNALRWTIICIVLMIKLADYKIWTNERDREKTTIK